MNETMTIREAGAEDAVRLAEIYNPYVTDTTISFEVEPLSAALMWERVQWIRGMGLPFLVSEDARGVVSGFCYAHPWKERPAYGRTLETTIYLAPEAQGQGTGRRLMDELLKRCRATGRYRSVIACITADNEASRRFHRSLGFEQVSEFKGVGLKFGQLLDVVDLQLLL